MEKNQMIKNPPYSILISLFQFLDDTFTLKIGGKNKLVANRKRHYIQATVIRTKHPRFSTKQNW